jgi:hypothetical protein
VAEVALSDPSLPAISAGNVPVFVGVRRQGALASTTLGMRVNGVAGAQVFNMPPLLPTTLSLTPPNNAGYLNASFRCDWAFVISGGGSSDYTSTALRTIIETYVSAVQAAIPG